MSEPKSQDALEELRRLAEMHRGVPGANPLTPPIRQTLERLAAAWEKERAERERAIQSEMRKTIAAHHDLHDLRAEVQAVEEECSQLCHEAPCPDLCFEPDLCSTFRKIRDRLRKARTGRSAKEV